MAVPYALTVDGFESQIGTNHLGHFALTNLLLPKVTDRVVTVSSIMHLIGQHQPQGPELEVAAVLGLAGLRSVQAGQPAVHQRAAAPARRRRVAGEGASPRTPATRRPTCRATPATAFGTRFWNAGNRLLATDADFGARQTLYAASAGPARRQLHRPAVRDARARPAESPRSPLARDAKKATALWTLSEQLTDTEFRALRLPASATLAAASRRGWLLEPPLSTGTRHLMVCDPGRARHNDRHRSNTNG